MPNSVDLEDQGRKSSGFPSEKPYMRVLAWLLAILTIFLCLIAAGQLWYAYILMMGE